MENPDLPALLQAVEAGILAARESCRDRYGRDCGPVVELDKARLVVRRVAADVDGREKRRAV